MSTPAAPFANPKPFFCVDNVVHPHFGQASCPVCLFSFPCRIFIILSVNRKNVLKSVLYIHMI